MKKRARLILFCCVLLFSALSVLAAPIPPLGPLDLSGTVTEAQWYPEKK